MLQGILFTALPVMGLMHLASFFVRTELEFDQLQIYPNVEEGKIGWEDVIGKKMFEKLFPAESDKDTGWIMDWMPGHYMNYGATDILAIPRVRDGRIGMMFFTIAILLIFESARIFLPNTIHPRQLELQRKRDPEAKKESIWIP